MKYLVLILVCLLLVFTATAYSQKDSLVTISWYGHAALHISTPDSIGVMLDPHGLKEYTIPQDIKTDIVTVSHNHFDHDQVSRVAGNPIILYGKSHGEPPYEEFNPIDTTIDGINIYDVQSNHFPPEVSPELNAIFVIELNSLRLVHLGDLGTTLNEEQIQQIGKVDILMIPVGGKYTIELPAVDTVISQLKPELAVIPMHYRTDVADFLPNTADDFVKGKANVVKVDGHQCSFNPADEKTEMQYIVLDYYK